MHKGRMEAFSDGVIAIIITIMVLELKVPHSADLAGIGPLLPVFLSYVLSFIYVGIYWNNHHHMMHTAERISGGVLWANLHLLFWMSLIPFVTGWVGENHAAPWPMAAYGCVLLMSAVAYLMLQRTILRLHGAQSLLSRAIGRDIKGRASVLCYAAAIGLAFVSPYLSGALYVLVAVMWFIPDRRIEGILAHAGHANGGA